MIQSIGASGPKRRAPSLTKTDEKTNKMMLRIADDYERMAKHAEERLRGKNSN
jgi:Na+/phosphate symporter